MPTITPVKPPTLPPAKKQQLVLATSQVAKGLIVAFLSIMAFLLLWREQINCWFLRQTQTISGAVSCEQLIGKEIFPLPPLPVSPSPTATPSPTNFPSSP